MKIGVPRELKTNENRVALLPAGAQVLVEDGHEVCVESEAGVDSGFDDEHYAAAGARLEPDAATLWRECDLILKVKEPLPAEYSRLRAGQVVFTYFHFAANRELTQAVMDSGAVAIAYETVQQEDGSLPLLVPMSEVAGRMAVQEGAKYLEKYFGGRGLLLSGVPGTARAEVVILGGGVVGVNAAKIAAGMGANVSILEVDLERLRYLDDVMPANVSLLYSDPHTLRDSLRRADVVVGAVLLPGKKTPRLITRAHLREMQDGAVLVDVAVDQGGCAATSHPTTHARPTYVLDGVIHYCVANMPAAVPRTSTIALNNATFPWARRLAKQGWREACRRWSPLRHGLNVVAGQVTHRGVAEAFDFPWREPLELLESPSREL